MGSPLISVPTVTRSVESGSSGGLRRPSAFVQVAVTTPSFAVTWISVSAAPRRRVGARAPRSAILALVVDQHDMGAGPIPE